MKFDIYKAKEWMIRQGMDHIQSGLFCEGGRLIYEAKWNYGCSSENNFRDVIKSTMNWPDEDIDEALREIKK